MLKILMQVAYFLISIYAIFHISYFIHELGHHLSAEMLGWRTIFFQFGHWGVFRRKSGWKLEKRDYTSYQSCSFINDDSSDSKILKENLIVQSSGYLFHLLLLMVLSIFAICFSGIIRYLFASCLVVSFLIFIDTISKKWEDGVGCSDYVFIKLLYNKDSRPYAINMLKLEKEVFSEIRFLEDIEENRMTYPVKNKLQEIPQGQSIYLHKLHEFLLEQLCHIKKHI